MIRSRWLVLAFLLALPLAVIWKAPASLVTPLFSGVPLGGAPLLCGAPHGTLWQGGCQWRWRQYQGGLSWSLAFSGITPGADVVVTGDILASGWLGGAPGTLAVSGLQGRLPATLLSHLAPATAEGELRISDLSLRWQSEGISDAAGSLRYSGGEVGWNGGRGEATLPVLTARIEPLEQGAGMKVTDAEGNLLMHGEVLNNSGSLKVFRAWPIALGVSSGGNAEDVVFQTSRPLW